MTSSLAIWKSMERNWLKLQQERLNCYMGRHQGNLPNYEGSGAAGELWKSVMRNGTTNSFGKHGKCGSTTWSCFPWGGLDTLSRVPTFFLLLDCSSAFIDSGSEAALDFLPLPLLWSKH